MRRYPADAKTGPDTPMRLQYSSAFSVQQSLKSYEDFYIAEPTRSAGFSVYGVFDGHHGDSVSHFLSCRFVPELERRLASCHLSVEQPETAYAAAEYVRRAVTATFLSLAVQVQAQCKQHEGMQQQQQQLGHEPGCGSTATVAVQIGPLLTVANCGNSLCVLDVGHTAFECTADHKLGNNEDEEARLDAAGGRVARLRFDLSGPALPGEGGCGQLRLWPGGLHMSRAIGDADCGPLVLPHPHIQQMWLPQRASRLILASGSVWDAFETFHKAAGTLREVSLENAAAALLGRVQRRKQPAPRPADATVLVVDFVPEACTSFKSQVRLDRLSRCSACSNNSASSSAAAAAAGLARKLSSPKLLQLGMMRSTPQQQKQHENLRRHSTGATGPVSAAAMHPSSFGAAAPATTVQAGKQQQQQHGMPPTALPPVPGLQQQQQQQQQLKPRQKSQQQLRRSNSLVQGLRAALCIAAPAAVSDNQLHSPAQSDQHQQQQQQQLQQWGSFGSSSADTTCSHATALTATGSVQTVSSSSSGSSSWRWSRSWRRSSSGSSSGGTTASKTTTTTTTSSSRATPRQHQPQPEFAASSSTARIFAQVDSWLAYFGSYQPLDRQLAVLDASMGLGSSHPQHCYTQQQQHGVPPPPAHLLPQQPPALHVDSMRAAAAAAPVRHVKSSVDLSGLDKGDQDCSWNRACARGLHRDNSLGTGTISTDLGPCATGLSIPLSE